MIFTMNKNRISYVALTFDTRPQIMRFRCFTLKNNDAILMQKGAYVPPIMTTYIKQFILAQAQNQWQNMHIVWYYFPYRIYTRLHLVGNPYDFKVVASLMDQSQTVRPLWLLQGEGTLILVCPWHIISDINCLNPI